MKIVWIWIMIVRLSGQQLWQVQGLASVSSSFSSCPPSVVILGGTGRIGTAIATHLLRREPTWNIILTGRKPLNQAAFAIEEIHRDVVTYMSDQNENTPTTIRREQLSYRQMDSVWDAQSSKLQQLIQEEADIVIHAAGPYLNEQPIPLQLAIQSPRCQTYVDASDPIPFLEASLKFNEMAQQSSVKKETKATNDIAAVGGAAAVAVAAKPTTALLAAGAFPGMSNVFAMEAAHQLQQEQQNVRIEDVRFNYFTSGLGGSGVVNLYITNLGFGEPMTMYNQGKLQSYRDLSGKLLGKVDFFIPQETILLQLRHNDDDHDDPRHNEATIDELAKQNKLVQERVGRQTVFAWPFPEAATTPKELQALGNSYAAMGTAPDLWNEMLGILVTLIPRSWWKNPEFCKFMADFSQPLVWMTDKVWLQNQVVGESSDGYVMGETHAMRIDVTAHSSSSSSDRNPSGNDHLTKCGCSIVQAHDSFRVCVGQSCAEFALDCWYHPQPGVSLPEQTICKESQSSTYTIEINDYTRNLLLYGTDPPTKFDESYDDEKCKREQWTCPCMY